MPELPEVEITRQGIAPIAEGRRVTEVRIRNSRLRWPISPELAQELPGQIIHSIERRAKYLLLRAETGTVIMHLGMSGSLRFVAPARPANRHEHADILLDDDYCLRLHDPRRFGALLWTRDDPHTHPLLASLGQEPLDVAFNGAALYERACGRRQAVKAFITDSHNVAGVGNIYANEALFVAKIHPQRAAGRISRARYCVLANAIQQVLRDAIRQGGTTLRDFTGSDGRPGHFRQSLRVYGRCTAACVICQRPLRGVRIAQRSTVYCAHCQR